MSRSPVRRIRSLIFIVIGALLAALVVPSSLPTVPGVSAAPLMTVSSCTPSTVATFTNRVHVSCNPAVGSITYFAYCSTQNPGLADRFLSVFTTAKALGKVLYIYYDPNDTSGTACGCGSGDCRVITGAEVRP